MSIILNFKIFFVYIILLSIGLNLKLARGLYIFDILMLIYILIFSRMNIRLPRQDIILWLILDIFLIISILISSIGDGYFYINSVRYLYSIAILFIFYIFIENLDLRKLNYNLVLSLLSIPVILSFLMFIDHRVEALVLHFYHLEKYPGFGRYGGVFGQDVNSLGLYSTLILWLSIVLYKLKLIKRSFFIFFIIISLFDILLSGMRTGILVFFGALLFFNKRLKLINFKRIFVIAISFIVLLVILFRNIPILSKIKDYIIDRFSIHQLMQNLGLEAKGSNLHVAIDYFYRVTKNYSLDFSSFLFGMNSKLVYVDSFYIEMFIKHGAISIILLFLIFLYYLKKSIKAKNYFDIYLLFVTAIIGIKGTFIVYQIYMFILLFASFIWKEFYMKAKNENFNSR